MTPRFRPGEAGGPAAVERALLAGARFSREACSPRRSPGLAAAIWSRARWGLIGAALFVLFELVMLTAGSTMGMKF